MLEFQDVAKQYRKNGRVVRAADRMSFSAEAGELVVIHGPSGSGKSTLLLIAGGMLAPDAGTVLYGADDVYQWGKIRRNRYRKRTVGFVFQRFFLIPYLTIADNIGMPMSLQGHGRDCDDRVLSLAKRLRIEDRLRHRPAELSVGEQQRAAVARALAAGQQLVLADEPTGNLDMANAEIIADCLREEADHGRTVLMVTHNPSLVDIGTRSLRIESGSVAQPSG